MPTVATSSGNDLERFCSNARRQLVGALSLYLGDAGVAEELAHEALLRTVDRWADVRLMTNPNGWVQTVAFNLARSHFRRMAAERRAHARFTARETSAGHPDAADVMAVRAALTRLPRRQRQAVVCRYYLDMSAADTATAMRCSQGTVKAHLRSALVALRGEGLGVHEEDL